MVHCHVESTTAERMKYVKKTVEFCAIIKDHVTKDKKCSYFAKNLFLLLLALNC